MPLPGDRNLPPVGGFTPPGYGAPFPGFNPIPPQYPTRPGDPVLGPINNPPPIPVVDPRNPIVRPGYRPAPLRPRDRIPAAEIPGVGGPGTGPGIPPDRFPWPRREPGANDDFNVGLPIGRSADEDTFGDILTRHFSLFSGLTIKDFFSFVPERSGLTWLKVDVEKNKYLLASAEGKGKLDIEIRNARKNAILKQYRINSTEIKKAFNKNAKASAVEIVTSRRLLPGRPLSTGSDLRIKYDRRMHGRSTMAASIPSEFADIASSKTKFAQTGLERTLPGKQIADVGAHQDDAILIAEKFYDR